MTRSAKKQLRGDGAKLGSKLSRGGELARDQQPKPGHKERGEHLAKSHKTKSLVEFFRESPLVGLELDLERDRD